ncbi:MAG: hypothetical protein IPO09_02860 [Anaeromyxobacter sp.]|nr:hypothetical protein [Anaeromyxobacter sp.]MBL0275523.1 hypothetical protein [Anaeromyxobacter sp.]
MSRAPRRPTHPTPAAAPVLLALALVLSALPGPVAAQAPLAPAPGPPSAVPEPEPTPVPAPRPVSDDEEDDPSLYQGWATPAEAEPPPARQPITLLLDLGAYYSSAGLYLPLGGAAPPAEGERGEVEIYASLLSRALVPRVLVLEASVNPAPCLGLLARRWDAGYQAAQVNGDFNLLRALTAGFEEPFALSLFLGNVADFSVKGRGDVRGRGYLGLVASGGLGHIKDNRLVDDQWLELEVKLKGDRSSEVKQLSWSFRAGVKLHSNQLVTDLAFFGVRRSRVDYQAESLLVANSGLEYRFDLGLDGTPLRHFLLVDKKWPLGSGRLALVFGVGVLWESGAAYTGALAERRGEALQLLLRPNLVF